jgi:hypothetical protein
VFAVFGFESLVGHTFFPGDEEGAVGGAGVGHVGRGSGGTYQS